MCHSNEFRQTLLPHATQSWALPTSRPTLRIGHMPLASWSPARLPSFRTEEIDKLHPASGSSCLPSPLSEMLFSQTFPRMAGNQWSHISNVILERDFLTSPPRASHSLCWSFPGLLIVYIFLRMQQMTTSLCAALWEVWEALCGSPRGPLFLSYPVRILLSTLLPKISLPWVAASTYLSLCISRRADFVVWKSRSCEYWHSCCGNSSCTFPLYPWALSVHWFKEPWFTNPPS